LFLAGARPDYCAVLRRWKREHWRLDFSVSAAIGVPDHLVADDATDPSEEAKRAAKAVGLAVRRLEELGVAPSAARKFGTATQIILPP
jgi:hypothetical protein